jgi:hypothetical protein
MLVSQGILRSVKSVSCHQWSTFCSFCHQSSVILAIGKVLNKTFRTHSLTVAIVASHFTRPRLYVLNAIVTTDFRELEEVDVTCGGTARMPAFRILVYWSDDPEI